MNVATQAWARLQRQRALWVTVESTQGSVPRDNGAWMAVFDDALLGTIGGGRVEFEAVHEARRRLAGEQGPAVLRYPLGPGLGQCCGGVMHLRFEPVQADDIPALQVRFAGRRMPVALFGGGHVGHALVQVLAPLPMDVWWLDSRDGVFPAQCHDTVRCEHSEPVQSAVSGLPAGTRVVIMSFSHAEDLDIVAACLARQRAQADLPYVGLIGSQTKWAVFRSRLAARGFTDTELAHVTCPIGVPGIADKRPEVIAVAVAAQLLQTGVPPAAG